MDPEFWLERWRQQQIGFHRDSINPHIERHWPGLGAAPGCRVFVPLCGKSLDMLWLAGQGHRVVGIEISPIAVEAFFTENGLEPEIDTSGCIPRWRSGEIEILCGDFFDLLPEDLGEVGALYDRAALIALPPAMRPRYARHLARLVPPGARGLLITLEYPQGGMEGPPFSVPEDEVAGLFASEWHLERLAREDVLAQNPRFRERGLDRLDEVVWRLQRLP